MHTALANRPLLAATLCGLGFLLGGCVLGPKYQRPSASTPNAWRWQDGQAIPAATLGTNWWESYNDLDLNALQQRSRTANQGIRRSLARLEESRAALGVVRSERSPQVSLGTDAHRERRSPNRRFRNFDDDRPLDPLTRNQFTLSLDTQYELDFWGRVRRAIESASAQLEAQAAANQTVALTISADVTRVYFEIRCLDSESEILKRSIELRRNSLNANKVRINGGSGAEADVSRAETELAVAEADLIEIRRSRTLLEHSLAVLCGESPSDFRLDPRSTPLPPPPIPPAGLPSELLLRRPDVVEAERLAASHCASIGVAKAAFLPTVRLTGSAGFESVDIQNVLSWESRAWSFGPSVSLPIFRGGRNRANLKAAEARYEEAVAGYKEQALVAFREVEDALASARFLSEKAEAQTRARDAARRTASYFDQRFQGGLINYLDIIESQRTLLQTERATIHTLAQRYEASVLLMKALGGGWHQVTTTPGTTDGLKTDATSH